MKNQGNDPKMIEEDALVLIVDDDTDVCNVLEEMISRLGIRVEITSNPLEVLDLVRNTFFTVILLDIRMPEKSGMELLPEIVEVSPDTKIIVVSEFGDKDSAISALRLGAFDFLEKPFEYKLLSHSIQRALETQKTKLAYKHEKKKLQNANRRLAENNEALSTLARNIERCRNDYEANIEKEIRVSILPIIENLQQSKGLSQNHQRDLELMMDLMADLTSTLDVKQDLFTVLTPTELRTALLIRNGLTTDEIAKHMHISPETVKSHRKNIRKKLGLNKSHHNLRVHLQAALDR
jgi:FixJ family two-component response regulator